MLLSSNLTIRVSAHVIGGKGLRAPRKEARRHYIQNKLEELTKLVQLYNTGQPSLKINLMCRTPWVEGGGLWGIYCRHIMNVLNLGMELNLSSTCRCQDFKSLTQSPHLCPLTPLPGSKMTSKFFRSSNLWSRDCTEVQREIQQEALLLRWNEGRRGMEAKQNTSCHLRWYRTCIKDITHLQDWQWWWEPHPSQERCREKSGKNFSRRDAKRVLGSSVHQVSVIVPCPIC